MHYFNSTSIDCTRKFWNFWGSSRAIRRISDRICIENGLSIIENPKPSKGHYGTWLGDKKRVTWQEKLMQAIDVCLEEKPVNFAAFVHAMKAAGYEIKQGKLLKFRAPGQTNFTKVRSLGEDYSYEAILERIEGKRIVAPKEKSSLQLLLDICFSAISSSTYSIHISVFTITESFSTSIRNNYASLFIFINSCYNTRMVTIKEISKEIGVSPSTVSIVLSGKADERKISEKTRQEVLSAAQRLGYRVNIAARRLRVKHDSSVMISVFMAMDQRAYMMTRFMLALYNAASLSDNQIEIVAHYYTSGFLHSMAEKIALTNCAIICNANDEDQQFLESVKFPIPIVLYYRSSEKYFSVNTNQNGGKTAAEIFARRKHKHAVLLETNAYFAGMKQSTVQFTETATAHGLKVTSIYETHDMRGGYQGGLSISKMNPLPDCILSMADTMSIGLLRSFGQTGIKIPDQIELISMGTENPDLQEYASTAISSIYFPIEELAEECIRLLFLQLDGKINEPFTVEIPSLYIQRESCGE